MTSSNEGVVQQEPGKQRMKYGQPFLMNRNEPIKAMTNIFALDDEVDQAMYAQSIGAQPSATKKKGQNRKEVQEIENISTIRTDKVEGGQPNSSNPNMNQ
eukprot:CAMPEP_0202960256 /NCGR_PEP_ID=MMETSP1396-20130829/4398_1 /ASSEMBLY_ACC=CAM_ASM_000872 /TAXON_ID= /ORGANISM="Pseudokeronopsis sp., Strain Brazil" /LENGTH=99 /DNA_ID=CAMNT_0049679349 /DNA_START=131 /DNA_END=430 /DNA_ORIENTATION=-